MNGFIDIYSIIFLVLAIVIFLRLRSVLGRRTGNERPPFDPYSRSQRQVPKSSGRDDKVISLPGREGGGGAATAADPGATAEDRVRSAATPGSSLGDSLVALAKADASFDAEQFLSGAKAAYEMIVTAYADGERKTLKQLLSREVYDGFVSAIDQRESRGEVMEFKFVGIDKAAITDATVRAGTAHVTVKFRSKLISATYDSDGKVIDGDPVRVSDVTDIWTFAREVSSRDPNWKLAATESVE
jgi:predicted lipid-binding transport protein (Tim44 family)